MFVRKKKSGPREYLVIPKHRDREGKKVKQKTIANLGRVDILRETGKLDSIISDSAKRDIAYRK